MNSSPFGVALVRGIVAMVATGALTFFTSLALDLSLREIISVAGVAGLTPFVVRFGFEGYVDTKASKLP